LPAESKPTDAAATTSDPSASESSGDNTDSPAASSDSSASTKRGPRYELKAFQKWALENPDQAKEFFQDVGKHVFKEGKEINGEWVALTNKTRKRLKQIDERHAQTMAEQTRVRDENAGHLKQIETHVQQIRPVLTMWQGAQRKDDKGQPLPDFDAVDAAFFQTTQGLSIDDYVRMRARRGIRDPRTAQLQAEVATLRQQLQAGAPQAQAPAQTNGAAGKGSAPAGRRPEANAPPTAAPAAPAEDLKAKWNGEIPKGHKLRQFDGWEKLLDEAMDQYDDGLGGYNEDPEAIADRIAKKQIEALAADFEEFEEPAPAPRRVAKKVAPKPAQTPPRRASAPTNGRGVPSAAELTPRGHKVGHEPQDPANPLDWARRQDWAIQRAQARARGEAVD